MILWPRKFDNDKSTLILHRQTHCRIIKRPCFSKIDTVYLLYMKSVSFLLFADDLVLIGNSVIGLQKTKQKQITKVL